MSTTTWVVAELKMHTVPSPGATPTTAASAVSWPATKFTFDAVGRGWSHGYTVRYPGRSGSVAVTFRATAFAPVRGTSWAAVGDTVSTSPAASLRLAGRVSAMRVGTTLAARLSPSP